MSNTADWIAFDEVEIDVRGHRLIVAGAPAPLEPKAFAVLLLLARDPGRVFTHVEILDAVWGHRHVTIGVLNRVITILRKALGESGEAHRYVCTVHGVGYRFDADARTIVKPDVQQPAGRSERGPVMAAAADLRATAGDSPQAATDALAVTRPADAAASYTDSARAHPEGWRWRSIALLSLLLLAALLGWLAVRREFAAPPPGTPPILIVLPLQVLGSDHTAADMAAGLSEELATHLAHIAGLTLISQTSAALAHERKLDFVQLAQQLHVSHAIEGSLRQEDDHVRIDLRLIEVPAGKTAWAQDYDRKFADMLSLQSEIAQAVATALSLRMTSTSTAEPPPDPEVFREYLELRQYILSHSRSPDFYEAEGRLKALAARAPDFAAVHGLLALQLAKELDEQKAVAEATQALKTDPASPYAHAALGVLACNRHDWNDCMNELRVALAPNAGDSYMNLNMGIGLAILGYREEALRHFMIAHATDPLSYWMNLHVGTELDVLGRSDEARVYFDALSEPLSSTTILTRWYNAISRQDYLGAHDIAAQMPDDDPRKASALAVADAFAHPVAWPDALKEMHAFEEKTGQTSGFVALVPRPDVAKALRRYGGFDFFEGKFIWGPSFAAIRRDPAFSELLRRAKVIDYWNEHGWPPQCKQDGSGARCD